MDRKKELIEGMIKKAEDDLILLELDVEFYNRQGLLNKEMAGIGQMKEKQVAFLNHYLKFLKEKLNG